FNADTLQITDKWRLTVAEVTRPAGSPTKYYDDADWGTTPVVLDDANGRHLIAATNKNGVVYAFDRAHIAQGFVWKAKIAFGGGDPFIGSVSSGVFANGLLYMAGACPSAKAQGKTYVCDVSGGTLSAIRPEDGSIKWSVPTAGRILPALAGATNII